MRDIQEGLKSFLPATKINFSEDEKNSKNREIKSR